MLILKRYLAGAGVAGLCLAAHAVERPDHFTDGFYTRGVSEAALLDEGGVIDPYHMPVKGVQLIPRVSVAVSSSDNFYVVGEGDEEGATQLYLTPGLLAIYGLPEHNHIYTDVGVQIPLILSGSEEDQPNYFGRVGGVYKTGKTQFSGAVGYRRTEQVSESVAARVLDETALVNGAVEHRISQKTSLGVTGVGEWHTYSDDDYSDYQRYYGAARVYRRITPKSDVFVQAGAGRDVIEDSADAAGNAHFNDWSIGMRGRPTPKTSVSGRVGYSFRTHDDGETDDLAEWIASFGADFNPFGLTRYFVDVQSDMRPDISGDSGTTRDQRIEVGLDRRLFTERLRGTASYQYGMLNYYSGSDENDSDYWGYNLGLDWWTRRNMSFGVGYTYVQRSGDDYSSYESGSFSFRMSLNY